MITQYINFNSLDMSGQIREDIEKIFRVSNKEKTLEHSINVAKTSIIIAEKFNLDKRICEIASYLHDISVIISPTDMLQYAKDKNWYIDKAEEKYPFLLHQRCSVELAKEVFNIKDNKVVDSIGCHTTLKLNPTQYDMALFIADKLSWDQDGKPPFYDLVKGELNKSLQHASLAYMNYIVENKLILYPHKYFIEGKKWLEEVRNYDKINIE